MSTRSVKIIILEIVILITLLTLWFVGKYKSIEANVLGVKKGNVEVTFFNVGKADCILIQTHKTAIMLDTGYEENGEDIVRWLEERGINSLNYLILSHPDKDHIGGADHIINKVKVEELIETNCAVDSDDYMQYTKLADEMGVKRVILKEVREIELEDTKIMIYPPIRTDFKGENDYSLVVKLIHGDTSFLFAGDAEDERIKEVMSQIPNLKSNLLKVSHHGIINKNSKEFFKMVQPEYSIITSEKKKMYEEAKENLESINSKVYVTKNGTIHVISDGSKLFIKQ